MIFTSYESIFDLTAKSRKEISDLICGCVEDVVLVENASGAVNSVLRSFGFVKGDKVLRLSTAYSMVTETLNWLEKTLGIEQVVVNVDFPYVNDEQILHSISDAMKSNPAIKLCVYSHITSVPTIILPVKDMTEIIKTVSKDIVVLIDGAHAPGVISIDVSNIGCDYYTGNLHKWMYAPKGCAFLWSLSERQKYECVQPNVISSRGMNDYVDRFAYTGTRDYTAFASIVAAFEYCRSIGGFEHIYQYNHNLVIQGARICCETWGTELLAASPDSYTYMCDVILPINEKDALWKLHNELKDSHGIFLVCSQQKLASGKTVGFCRLSAQIYLDINDFQILAEKVKSLTTA